MLAAPGMRKPGLLLASCYRWSNYQSCQKIATINRLHFNAIIWAFSNSVQRGDPYSQKIWQLQPPLSDPLPHPPGAERNPHTQCRGSTPWPSAQSQSHTHTHRARQPGRQAGCGGIWERYTGNAGEHCVSISLFRNAKFLSAAIPSLPSPTSGLLAYRDSISHRPHGSSNPDKMLLYAHHGAKWQQHWYSLTSQPLRLAFMCLWLFCWPLLSLLLKQNWKQVDSVCIQGKIFCLHYIK